MADEASPTGLGEQPLLKPSLRARRTGLPEGSATRMADYKSLSDQEIVLLARQGKEVAYRELIGRYQRPVLSLIYRIVRDREKAEDLAQETFIKVLNAIDRYDP